MIRTNEANLLESGASSLIVGTVSADGAPDATRAWGVRLVDGRLRFVLPAQRERAIGNLGSGGAVAITATDVPTLRSVQVKGHALLVEAAGTDDITRSRRYQTDFLATVEATDGTPVSVLENLAPRAGLVAVECTVEAVFDQTPGPAAGHQLAPTVAVQD